MQKTESKTFHNFIVKKDSRLLMSIRLPSSDSVADQVVRILRQIAGCSDGDGEGLGREECDFCSLAPIFEAEYVSFFALLAV